MKGRGGRRVEKRRRWESRWGKKGKGKANRKQNVYRWKKENNRGW